MGEQQQREWQAVVWVKRNAADASREWFPARGPWIPEHHTRHETCEPYIYRDAARAWCGLAMWCMCADAEERDTMLINYANDGVMAQHERDRMLQAFRDWLGPSHACAWTQCEDGQWETDCGGAFEIYDGAPSDNRMRACCYCGGTLVEHPYHEQDDDDA